MILIELAMDGGLQMIVSNSLKLYKGDYLEVYKFLDRTFQCRDENF